MIANGNLMHMISYSHAYDVVSNQETVQRGYIIYVSKEKKKSRKSVRIHCSFVMLFHLDILLEIVVVE